MALKGKFPKNIPVPDTTQAQLNNSINLGGQVEYNNYPVGTTTAQILLSSDFNNGVDVTGTKVDFNGALTNGDFLFTDSTGINAAQIANGSVSNAEYQYLDGVNSPIQAQINAKASVFNQNDMGIEYFNANIPGIETNPYFVYDYNQGFVGVGTPTPVAAFDAGIGKFTGGTYSYSYRTFIDCAGDASFPTVDFQYDNGTGSLFRAAQADVFGTGDVFNQLFTGNQSGYGIIEAFLAAGLVLGTGACAGGIFFKIERSPNAYIATNGNWIMDPAGDLTPTARLDIRGYNDETVLHLRGEASQVSDYINIADYSLNLVWQVTATGQIRMSGDQGLFSTATSSNEFKLSGGAGNIGWIVAGSSGYARYGADRIGLGSGTKITWHNNTDGRGGGDTGIARNAAGVVEINNATPGTFASLRCLAIALSGSTTAKAPLNIPTGNAPTSPVNGDIWQASNHVYARLNGVTYQLDQQGTTAAPISQSSSITIVPNQRYLASNASTRVVFTLPTTAAVGDQFLIRGIAAGLWRLGQQVGQTTHAANNTTTGTGGYLESQARYDCVTVECIIANTDFIIINQRGTLTSV